MFWGLILKANKKYTQTLEKPFHLSQAALDHSSSDDEPIQVMYNHEDSSYLLCTLQKGKVMQCSLDLNFAEGDKLCFLTKGNGIVHLTGFLIPEEDYGDFGSEEEESETELADLREKITKNKSVKEKNAKKPQEVSDNSEDEEDDEESDEQELDTTGSINEEDEEEEDSDEEEEDDEDEDDNDESEEEAAPPKPKHRKIDPQVKEKDKKQQNGISNGKDKQKNKENQQQKAGQMQKLQGGLMYQDLKVGNGAEAKVGKRIQVYYEGRFKANNKVFDSTKSGPGFKLSLGRGEVIKGWDIGLAGMKVGGKRRIICPPNLAYGQKGHPPAIPPNSTLIFDVELKNVL